MFMCIMKPWSNLWCHGLNGGRQMQWYCHIPQSNLPDKALLFNFSFIAWFHYCCESCTGYQAFPRTKKGIKLISRHFSACNFYCNFIPVIPSSEMKQREAGGAGLIQWSCNMWVRWVRKHSNKHVWFAGCVSSKGAVFWNMVKHVNSA